LKNYRNNGKIQIIGRSCSDVVRIGKMEGSYLNFQGQYIQEKYNGGSKMFSSIPWAIAVGN